MQKRTCCIHSLATRTTPIAFMHGVKFPGSTRKIQTRKAAFIEGSWTVLAVRELGFGKHAKWVLFHPHQLQKLARQNMH